MAIPHNIQGRFFTGRMMESSSSEISRFLRNVEETIRSIQPLDSSLFDGDGLSANAGIQSQSLPRQAKKDLRQAQPDVLNSRDNRAARAFSRSGALSRTMTQVTPAQRSEEYKSLRMSEYARAVETVEHLFQRIGGGSLCDFSEIRDFVGSFLPVLMNDRSILLNLSNSQASGESYLPHHALNCSLIALNIAAASDFSGEQILEAGCSALLADVGMLRVPEAVLARQGALSPDEQFEILKHPGLGYELLLKVKDMPEPIRAGVYQHHERNNKKGYPRGQRSQLIHDYAKISGIADVYCALIAPRCYRKPFKPFDAVRCVIKMAETGLLDADFTKNFIRYMSLFPIGSFIKLASGKIGKVIQANDVYYSRPVVSVIFNENDEIMGHEGIYQIDLSVVGDEKVVMPLGKPLSRQSLMVGF